MLAKLLLPPAVRGRWGITPGDCNDTLDDDKGLMLVEPGSLRFPDGSAAVHVVNALGANQWRADFLVVEGGERRWETITLTLSQDGKTLTRESGDQSWTYRRCEGRP